MRTVLLPVDGSACSERAIEEVVKLVQKSGPMDIHLLNVQPRIFVEETLVFLDPAKMDSFYYSQGSKALTAAEKLLKKAEIAFTAHRAVGPVAETIVTKAKELGADGILMGTHGHGRVAGMLLGSVSNKVLHLSPVPVTLVRPDPPADFGVRLSTS
ncbi:MAG: universal stress protein [Betaproteobacteria bacterium]